MSEQPAGALIKVSPTRNPALAGNTFDDLISELLQRMRDGEEISGEQRIFLGQELQERLADALEVHHNRFSITNLRDLFRRFHTQLGQKPTIEGASIVEVGSGSHNPLSLLFIFVMLGAKKGIAIDLEEVQEWSRALRSMARSADVMLLDSGRIVEDYPTGRAQIEQNLVGFDLRALREGKSSGLDTSRLNFQCESAAQTSIASSSVDIIFSNSFFEHLEDPEEIISEMARITVPGGLSIHAIDCVDHAIYGDPACHPLQFLRVSKPGMINGSNRLRLPEFPTLFGRHDFKIQEIIPIKEIEIDDATHQSFALPWSAMPRKSLELIQGLIVARRN